jgi:hypothetical protein
MLCFDAAGAVPAVEEDHSNYPGYLCTGLAENIAWFLAFDIHNS